MVNGFNEAKCIFQSCHKTLVHSGRGSMSTIVHLVTHAIVAVAVSISAVVAVAQAGAGIAIIATGEAIVVAEVVVRAAV